MNKANDSVIIGDDPSADEKIWFLMLNENENDKATTASIITIEDDPNNQTAGSKIFSMTDSAESTHMSEFGLLGSSEFSLNLKQEESHRNVVMDKLRRKVCRKIYSILRNEYAMPNIEAKNVTLAIDGKVNSLFPAYTVAKNYVLAIKNLFHKLRVSYVHHRQKSYH